MTTAGADIEGSLEAQVALALRALCGLLVERSSVGGR